MSDQTEENKPTQPEEQPTATTEEGGAPPAETTEGEGEKQPSREATPPPAREQERELREQLKEAKARLAERRAREAELKKELDDDLPALEEIEGDITNNNIAVEELDNAIEIGQRTWDSLLEPETRAYDLIARVGRIENCAKRSEIFVEKTLKEELEEQAAQHRRLTELEVGKKINALQRERAAAQKEIIRRREVISENTRNLSQGSFNLPHRVSKGFDMVDAIEGSGTKRPNERRNDIQDDAETTQYKVHNDDVMKELLELRDGIKAEEASKNEALLDLKNARYRIKTEITHLHNQKHHVETKMITDRRMLIEVESQNATAVGSLEFQLQNLRIMHGTVGGALKIVEKTGASTRGATSVGVGSDEGRSGSY